MAGKPFDYEPVEDRIRRFWEAHPNGRIITEVLHADEQTVLVRAEVWRDQSDPGPAAVGHAEENRTGRINETWAVENGETSAAGRALANCGFAPKGKRPSREEMDKPPKPPRPRKADSGQSTAPLKERLNSLDAKQRGVMRATLEQAGFGLPLPDMLPADRFKELEGLIGAGS